MGFNSLEYLLLLVVVFLIYWRIKDNIKKQNWLLLVSSYFFYVWWDWRFLFLIVLSSAVDFYVGKAIPKASNASKAKMLMWLSVFVNLSLLGVFKYYNFFVESLIYAFSTIGVSLSIHTLKFILPVGISFYTFQTLSYTIDIHRKRIKPTESWLNFFAFVSFFPQLVAGPIERASALLPQFEKKREYSYAQTVEGLRFILYGLFKKIVIADYVGEHCNEIFANYESFSGSDLFLGIYVFYGIQIYCDFSGYSDMAIGSARILGFKLSRNFNYPYFSRSVREFWGRWHITLSNWFRDYVLIAMLRSPRWKKLGPAKLTIIMFILIGLWHGASSTLIMWGFLNGLWFVIYMRLVNKKVLKQQVGPLKNSDIPAILVTCGFIGFFEIFFRSPSLAVSFGYIYHMFSWSFFTLPTKWSYVGWPIILIVWEWNSREHWHGLHLDHWKKWQRWGLYLVMCLLIMHEMGRVRQFIYFQF